MISRVMSACMTTVNTTPSGVVSVARKSDSACHRFPIRNGKYPPPASGPAARNDSFAYALDRACAGAFGVGRAQPVRAAVRRTDETRNQERSDLRAFMRHLTVGWWREVTMIPESRTMAEETPPGWFPGGVRDRSSSAG